MKKRFIFIVGFLLCNFCFGSIVIQNEALFGVKSTHYENCFDITDSDILEAVRVHTFGEPGMCDLAKILYVADKIEPGRNHVTAEHKQMLLEKWCQ